MTSKSNSRLPRVFLAVMLLCAQYLVLTTAAMFFFQGDGGYSFFDDFFSELGQTAVPTGAANTLSCVLFNAALGFAGCGLALFFLAFPACFTESAGAKVLCRIARPLGVASGICFVGVAFTPMNLYLTAHEEFFMWAFRAFPIAVLLGTVAILLDKNYPSRFALVFGVFACMLIAYLLLISFGPGTHEHAGKVIQATGQKIIGYAAIGSVLVQAWGARGVVRGRTR